MSRDADHHSDPAALGVWLATEATLLEARLRMLQEELATVDSRIEAVSETLRRLRRPTVDADEEKHANDGSRPSHDGAAADSKDACPSGFITCHP